MPPHGVIHRAISPADIKELGMFMLRDGRIVEVTKYDEHNPSAFKVQGRLVQPNGQHTYLAWTKYGGFAGAASDHNAYMRGEYNSPNDIKWRLDPKIYPEYFI